VGGAAALLVTLLGGGCAQDEPASGRETAAAAPSADATSVVPVREAARSLREGAVALDVRTAEEFAAGHLAGARNIDATAADFEDRVAELDRDVAYVVYCASGNRAGAAVATMLELGFTDAVNGGGFEDLADAVNRDVR
jgi:rhodanese-related sulfurtransferase